MCTPESRIKMVLGGDTVGRKLGLFLIGVVLVMGMVAGKAIGL